MKLDVIDAYFPAVTDATQPHLLRKLYVQLLSLDRMPPKSCLSALAMFLAHIGNIRMVRPVVAQDSAKGIVIGLEVGFAESPGKTELRHALGALSIACRQFGGEVRPLTDQRIARQFLKMQKS